MEFCQRQSVLQDLELRLVQIRAALTDLADIQAQLQNNASESKNDIQFSFSRQLEFLRTREVYLLSQVDTLLQVKQDQLHLQVEKLSKELGVLEVLFSQAKSARSGVAVQDVEDIMKRFQQLQLVPEEDSGLSFEGDAKRMKKAILSFGSVTPQHPGKQSTADKIIGSFEQFAGGKVWLCQTPTSSSGTKDDTPHIIYPVFSEKGDQAAWLLKKSDDEVPTVHPVSDDDDQDSFVMIPQDAAPADKIHAFQADFASILNSPNIQWIRPQSKMASVGVSHHQREKPCAYYRPSGSTKDWLRKTIPKQQDVQEEVAMDIQVNACSPTQMPAKPIEIEDLAELACVQDAPQGAANPCAPKTRPPRHQGRKNATKSDSKQSSCCSTSSSAPIKSSMKTVGGVGIDEVCKANEKCVSFEECLCDENCGEAERPVNSFNGIPESSKNQWLIQTPPPAEKNRTEESEKKNEIPTTPKEETPKTEYVKEWLVSGTTPTTDYESSIVSSFLKWQLEENPIWLKRANSGCDPNQAKTNDQNLVDEWLQKSKSAAKSYFEDNKMSSEEEKKLSEWLLPRYLHSDVSAFKVPEDGASSAWLLKKRVEELGQVPMQEKWLVKQALKPSAFGPKPTGFPCFSTSMDFDQWLKK